MERAGQDVEAGVRSNINIQGLKGSVEGEEVDRVVSPPILKRGGTEGQSPLGNWGARQLIPLRVLGVQREGWGDGPCWGK